MMPGDDRPVLPRRALAAGRSSCRLRCCSLGPGGISGRCARKARTPVSPATFRRRRSGNRACDQRMGGTGVSTSAGTGSPVWFLCPNERRERHRARFLYDGTEPLRGRRHVVELTGRTRKYHPPAGRLSYPLDDHDAAVPVPDLQSPWVVQPHRPRPTGGEAMIVATAFIIVAAMACVIVTAYLDLRE